MNRFHGVFEEVPMEATLMRLTDGMNEANALSRASNDPWPRSILRIPPPVYPAPVPSGTADPRIRISRPR